MAPKRRRPTSHKRRRSTKAVHPPDIDVALEAIASLVDRVARLEHESRIQVMRMAQIQQQLDRVSAPETGDLGPGDRPIKRHRPS
jgi:hypothetical protein